MEVGIGLPSTIPGVGRHQLLEWARRAEARGFSTLGTIDRIVYPSHEPLIALAAAAAVTERIRLATTILLAPTRANGALLAKQAATLDVLSEGRLVLGVAVGRREDDFRASGVDFHARGRILDEMLDLWARIWDGEEFGTAGGSARGRPTAALPSSSAASRAPRSRAPRATATAGAPATARWRSSPRGRRACGPRGKPPGATARRGRWCSRTTPSATVRNRRSRAAWATTTGPRGPTRTRSWRGRRPTSEAVRENVEAFAQAGCDELIFFPCDPHPDQVDLLADALAT